MWLKPLDISVLGDRQLKLTAITAKADGNYGISQLIKQHKSYQALATFLFFNRNITEISNINTVPNAEMRAI